MHDSTPRSSIDPEDLEQCGRLALRLGTTVAEIQRSAKRYGFATDAVALGVEHLKRQRRPVVPDNGRHSPLIGILSESLLVQEQPLYAAATSAVHAVLNIVGGIPLIVPVAHVANVDAFLDKLDALFVPGGQSNVHPSRYGRVADGKKDGPFDHQRDEIALEIIPRALTRGIPALFTCRGCQELNVVFGGTLKKEPADLPENQKHGTPKASSEDARYALRQQVRVGQSGLLHNICQCHQMMVNSLHSFLIDDLAPLLTAEAVAEDGSVEAVSVRGASAFALGTLFHPEYWASSDPISSRIMSAFAAAAREHAATRSRTEG